MPRHLIARAALVAGALFLVRPASTQARAQGQAAPTGGETEAKPQAKEKAASPASPTKAQAMTALKEMGATLASARTMRFKIRNLVPTKTPGGDWFTVYGTATVMREGKDRLFVETGGDLFPFRLYFDGKTVTAFAQQEHLYAQREAPGTIDAMLSQAAKSGEVAFVFADLVSSDPYAAMTKGLQGALVVGISTVDGVEAQHLLVHSKQVDWEIWIGTQDRLPRMITITDIGEARKPTQIVQLSDWALGTSLPADTFAFTAPPDATKVPFRDPNKAMAAGRRAPPRGAKGGAP